MSRSRRVRWGVVCAVVVALAATSGVLLSRGGAPRSAFAGTAVVRPDAAWNDLFQSYGNTSGQWSGGDGAQSLPLPDGTTVWFFADTYLGTPGPGGTRSPSNTGLAHNTAVLYRGGVLGPTYAQPPGWDGYTGAGDYTWVIPPPSFSSGRYELINGGQVLDDGTIYKFYQLADRDIHPGDFPYKLVGTVIESFRVTYGTTDSISPAGGTPVGIQDTASSDPVIWGAATLVSGGYIYIYGVKPYNRGTTRYPLYLARVPVGGLADGNAWQYYGGSPGCPPSSSAWVSDPRAATVLRTGVSAGFSVTDVNGTYVLLTSDGSTAGTTSDAVAYYAACPAGFSPGSPRYQVYQPRLPAGWIAYEYRVVPQFSDGSDVLVSYSLNTLAATENFSDVAIYRPRFLDVRLPGITGPDGPVSDP
jgi:hypothetical protein